MKKRKIEVPLQNGKELKPIMIKPNMGRIIKPMAKFPDLSGDGKVTKKDILMGRGVIKKPKMTFDGDKNNKNIEKQLKNAVLLDNVEFGLNEIDTQTGSALESLRDAIKRRGRTDKGKGGLEGAAASRARFDKARKSFEGSNIVPTSFTANADGSIAFRLKDNINIPGVGQRQGGGRHIMDKEGNISHQAGKKYAPSPYFSKIGINTKNKPNMKKDTPKRTQIKKTGRELQNALIKEQNKPVTKQDKRVINQLQGAIEEQKKKLKNPTMKKPKMYKKPKASYMLSGLGTKKGQRKVKRAAKATARAKKNIDMVKISQTGKITKSGTVSSAKNQSRQGVALRQQKKATRLMGQALKTSTPSRRKAKRQAVKATKAEYVGGRKLGQVTKKTAVSLTKAKYERKKKK